jgi:hypothetical protein
MAEKSELKEEIDVKPIIIPEKQLTNFKVLNFSYDSTSLDNPVWLNGSVLPYNPLTKDEGTAIALRPINLTEEALKDPDAALLFKITQLYMRKKFIEQSKLEAKGK